jgi:hypothetical protein
MREEKFFDQLYKGVTNAIQDIREKVEESIWGRVVNERDTQAGPQWPQAREQEPEASFGAVTRTIDVGPTRDQMQENGNYRLAVMGRELDRPQWPKETGPTQDIGQDRDRNADRGMDR